MMVANKPRQSLILCWMLLRFLGSGRFSCVAVGLNHDVENAETLVDDAALHDASALDTVTEADNKGNTFLRQQQQQQQHQHRSLFGSLKQNFQVAKAKMAQKFKQDYGEDYYNEFFMISDWANGTARVTQGRRFFVSPSVERNRVATHENEGPSWNRMVRRLALKILQAQIQQNSNTGDKVTFIWATGGHSSAAGHGNYYNESYSAVMERSVTDVFEAVGLKFIGKNYAMGGSRSGMAISSCVKEIFGLDIDVLSWDFGMTDGRDTRLMQHYFYRSFFNVPTRPALFGFGIKGHESVLQRFENLGLTTLYGSEDVLKLATSNDKIPNCEGITPAQVKALPPMMHECKCTVMDDGKESCTKEKWTKLGNPLCDARPYQVSWHPGYWHAMVGNLLALSLMELLDDAVEMIDHRSSDPEAHYKELRRQQDADDNNFMNAPLPDDAIEVFKGDKDTTSIAPADIDLETVFRGSSLCHTGYLPAETRFLGILTESNQKGFLDFDKGQPQRWNIPLPEVVDGMIPLVYSVEERHTCPYAGYDFKDYFLVHESYGWTKLVLPNAREKAVYGPKKNQPALKGYIQVCWKMCPWGNCAKGNVNEMQIREDKSGEIKVNDKPVTELTNFGSCQFLKGTQGHVWEPNANGQYEISIRTLLEKGSQEIVAIVLW